jgi:hypothetical protein
MKDEEEQEQEEGDREKESERGLMGFKSRSTTVILQTRKERLNRPKEEERSSQESSPTARLGQDLDRKHMKERRGGRITETINEGEIRGRAFCHFLVFNETG